MARLTPEQWASLKAEWRTGSFSTNELGKKYGVDEKAIRKRAAREGWLRDLGDAVDARTARKILGAESEPSDIGRSERGDRTPGEGRGSEEAVRNPFGLIEEAIVEQMAERRATENLATLSRADDLKKLRNRLVFLVQEAVSGDMDRASQVAPVLMMGTGTNIPALIRSIASVDESLQKVVRTALGMDREAKTKVQVTGADGGPIRSEVTGSIDVGKLSTEQLAALAAVNRALDGEEARKGPPMPPGEEV
ncbi:hypothetical protein [Falsiroseomonas sp. CW058]|uniref:hypothetical protein n=1 Tax=Falsiroseomonas sp. CW058 TaxID=3388664 RepID=UPI003D314B33